MDLPFTTLVPSKCIVAFVYGFNMLTGFSSLLRLLDMRTDILQIVYSLQSTDGMRSSKFCLHPAGDTPSSCRLFDAIVSHCIPVIISSRIELPFEDEIDYSEFSLFFSVEEALEPDYLLNQLRQMPREKWVEMWSKLKNVSSHYEFQHPPRKDDAVNMIWRQVRHKIPAVNLAIHRSRRLKVPDWWWGFGESCTYHHIDGETGITWFLTEAMVVIPCAPGVHLSTMRLGPWRCTDRHQHFCPFSLILQHRDHYPPWGHDIVRTCSYAIEQACLAEACAIETHLQTRVPTDWMFQCIWSRYIISLADWYFLSPSTAWVSFDMFILCFLWESSSAYPGLTAKTLSIKSKLACQIWTLYIMFIWHFLFGIQKTVFEAAQPRLREALRDCKQRNRCWRLIQKRVKF